MYCIHPVQFWRPKPFGCTTVLEFIFLHSAAVGEPDSPDESAEFLVPSIPVQVSTSDPTASPVEETSAKLNPTTEETSPAVVLEPSTPHQEPLTTNTNPTSVVIPSKDDTHEIHTANIGNGPVEGWRNSTGSSDDSPGVRRKVKTKGQVGTHAEVASTRKHLKKCSMS